MVVGKRSAPRFRQVAAKVRRRRSSRSKSRFYRTTVSTGWHRGPLKTKLGERRGASTITQQLVGNMHPTIIDRADRSLSRKLAEQSAAREMEKHYTKEQVLEGYLNQIPFGHGWHGVESAARHYFGKSASKLTLPEAASLAAMPKGPALYDPLISGSRAPAPKRGAVLMAARIHHAGAGEERAATPSYVAEPGDSATLLVWDVVRIATRAEFPGATWSRLHELIRAPKRRRRAARGTASVESPRLAHPKYTGERIAGRQGDD